MSVKPYKINIVEHDMAVLLGPEDIEELKQLILFFEGKPNTFAARYDSATHKPLNPAPK